MAVCFALIQFGGGVSQIRGSIAGTTFSRNRAGAIARGRTKPINPGTIRQSEVRASFGSASTAWGGLTSAQIAEWDAYASLMKRINKLGEEYTPKGRQIFMEVTQNLLVVGETPINDPSGTTDVPSVTEIGTFTVGFTDPNIDELTVATVVSSFPGGGDGRLVFEATPPHSPKLTNVNNLFRQVQVLPADDPPFDLEAAYISTFGPTANVGQVIDLRVRAVDAVSGLGSSWLLTRSLPIE